MTFGYGDDAMVGVACSFANNSYVFGSMNGKTRELLRWPKSHQIPCQRCCAKGAQAPPVRTRIRGSGFARITLVTAQLADETAAQPNSIHRCQGSITSASSYWKASPNNQISMSVASVRTGVR